MKANNLLAIAALLLGSAPVLASDYQLGAPTYANAKETTYYPGGQVKAVVAVSGNKHHRDGEALAYYPDGKLLSKGQYRKNKPFGPYTQYFENGKVRLSASYDKKGKMAGPVEEYYDNGQLKMATTYDNGHARSTKEVHYYPSGEVLSRLERNSHGRKTGIRVDYFKNGKVSQEIPYKSSSREGTRKIYNDQGQLITKVEYKKDKPLYAVIYQDGKEVKKITDAKGLHPYLLKD